MIRPELKQAAWRARELLAGLGITGLGLWAAWGSFGMTRYFGMALLVIGVAVCLAGLQRFRLRPANVALGVITLDEGRLTYWGPLSGGTVSVDLLTQVAFDPGNRPATWDLTAEDGAYLSIPVTAENQDALVDWLSPLPGLPPSRLTDALIHPPKDRQILWTRPRDLARALN